MFILGKTVLITVLIKTKFGTDHELDMNNKYTKFERDSFSISRDIVSISKKQQVIVIRCLPPGIGYNLIKIGFCNLEHSILFKISPSMQLTAFQALQ